MKLIRCISLGAAALSTLPGFAGAAAVQRSTDLLVFPRLDPSAGTSSPRTVTLQNTGAAAVTVTTVGFAGGNAGFVSNSDGCNGAVLQPAGSCSASFSFAPTQKGHRYDRYSWTTNDGGPTQVLDLSNDYEQSSAATAVNRLPPVLEQVTIVQINSDGSDGAAPALLEPNVQYRARWYVASYDPLVQSTVAMFDCGADTAPVTDCGSDFGGNFQYAALSAGGLVSSTEAAVLNLSSYTFQGNTAYNLGYAYDFTVDSLSLSSAHTLVLRFYYEGAIDTSQGLSSVSLLVPGGLSLMQMPADYYASDGRRIAVPAGP
jgi:hypothetical protein